MTRAGASGRRRRLAGSRLCLRPRLHNLDPASAQNIAHAILGGDADGLLCRKLATGRKKQLAALRHGRHHRHRRNARRSSRLCREQGGNRCPHPEIGEGRDQLHAKPGRARGTPCRPDRGRIRRGLCQGRSVAGRRRRSIRTLRRDGCYTALVSGGFRYFTSRVAERVGFDIDISNDFEIRATARQPAGWSRRSSIPTANSASLAACAI